MRKTPLMKLVERDNGNRDIRDIIRERFDRQETRCEQARRLGIPQSTLKSWEDDLGMQIETTVRFESELAAV